MNDQAKSSGRRPLILMLLVAAASLGGSYALYYRTASESLWGTTNQGTFVAPPVNVASLELTDRDGEAVDIVATWRIWVVQAEPCGPECARALHQLRQLHILLNRDADRVTRALVSPAPLPLGELDAAYPDLEFLSGRIGELTPGIYIVDPLGNLVLRYPLESAGKPVLEDLKRLLKVSQIG